MQIDTQRETGYDVNLSIMYTFADDFSHNECQLINKEKHKLEIVSAVRK